MVDYEKIGKLILEERKYLRRLSQEKMAEDLGMYQADISNLEKAKNGSGITDLAKLDMIADYFDMPLEILIFGRRQNQMEKYYGTKMQLKEYKKKKTKKHITLLRGVMGLYDDDTATDTLDHVRAFECGPYMVYVAYEQQTEWTGEENAGIFGIVKQHIFVIYQDEIIGCATAAITTVMQHVYEPSFRKLKVFIQPDIFDLDEMLQVLNPYWLLYQYASDENELGTLRRQMAARMDELRRAGEDRVILYVENAYVREDCRRNGILRMMIDTMKTTNGPALIWLNMEPTSGAELHSEYSYFPAYAASELGQIHLNASIAEHLGFTIDSQTVNRQAERVEEDGSIVTETVPVRRTAYYLPKKIRNILNGDAETLAYARAQQKVAGGEAEKPKYVDIYQGAWRKWGFIISIRLVYDDEIVYAFARGKEWKDRWLGVSKENPAPTGEDVETIERYDKITDAEGSKYYMGLKTAEKLLGAVYFGTVRAEDVNLDDLSAGKNVFL